jgi:hypothetical protein
MVGTFTIVLMQRRHVHGGDMVQAFADMAITILQPGLRDAVTEGIFNGYATLRS